MDRKRTAWKKNRKFGDVHGGRSFRKITDGVFGRVHSLEMPEAGEATPIVRLDNASRDYFFPVSPEEVVNEMNRLPKSQTKGITHIWFRKFKKSDYERGRLPLASYVRGSGVAAIVLYPWPKSLQLCLGKRKPSRAVLRMYASYSTGLSRESRCWCLKFTLESLKRLYIELLLYHEIGHHIDRRRWTKANSRQVESFADGYAFRRTAMRKPRD